MSMESLRRLSELCKDRNGQITNSSPRIRRFANGVEYYFVEVTCEDGSQYGIQAYGEEAIALYSEAIKILK